MCGWMCSDATQVKPSDGMLLCMTAQGLAGGIWERNPAALGEEDIQGRPQDRQQAPREAPEHQAGSVLVRAHM